MTNVNFHHKFSLQFQHEYENSQIVIITGIITPYLESPNANEYKAQVERYWATHYYQ